MLIQLRGLKHFNRQELDGECMNKYLRIFLILVLVLLASVIFFYGGLFFVLTYNNQADYYSEGINLGSSEYYNKALANAREAGYKMELYYANAKENEIQRFYPGPSEELDSRLGPDYIVNSLEIYNSNSAWLSIYPLTNGESKVSFYNNYNAGSDFESINTIQSASDREWVAGLFKTIFGLDEHRINTYLSQDNSNTVIFNNVNVVEPLNFTETRKYLAEQATTQAFNTQTSGEGSCSEVFSRGNQKSGAINYIVPNTEISHKEGLKTYIVKIDQLGGLILKLNLGPASSGDKVPEEEYRAVFKQMFKTLGLPPEKADDIKFDYMGSVW